MRDRDLSVLALGVTVVAWASAFVGIRAAAESFSPGALTLGRLLVGLAALSLLVRPRLRHLPRGRPLALVLVYGVTWFGVYNIALNAAERDLDAGTTALIVNIGPILIALLAGLVLREGFPPPLMFGMAIAFAGVVLIGLSTRGDAAVGSASTTGVVLTLLAAVCYAVGALSQKVALRTIDSSLSVWLGCAVGAVVCLPFAPQLVAETRAAPLADVGWVVFLGVVPTAVGFVAWSYALARLSAGQTGSTTYLVPAVATLLSWLVLAEVPAPLAFVGGALCLLGVSVTRLRRG